MNIVVLPKAEPTLEEAFQEFYAGYPRKKKPKDARKAYMAERREGIDHAHIMAGERRMVAALPNPLTKEDKRYLPYPATWLRAGGYDDVPDEDEEFRYDGSYRLPTPEEAEIHKIAFGRDPKMVLKGNPVSNFVKDRARQNGWRG